jgi:alpha-mannosidase
MTMRSNMALATLLGLSLLGQEAPSKYELPPEQRTGGIKRIYVVCHSHLDIGFTRPPDEVARDYKDNIDAAIRLTRENKDFRWTIESAWMLEEWLRRTDDEALIAELGQMLRDGRMGFGVAFANMHSGLMGAEESNRLVYLGEKFRRKFGLKTAVAFQNDVPGFTWAYPRILAGSGVKRLVTGLNLFIGGGNSLGVSQNPFYWVGPDGSRVLTYFTYDSYMEGYRWKLSGRFPMEELEKTAPRRLAWLEKNGYKYDTYLLMASAGDNIHPEGSFRTLQRIREWNAKHSELPMKMVTAEEFFDYLQTKYGDRFPSVSGDAAGHWETVKLRVPEAASKMRQVSSDLPAAEAAATIASLLTRDTFPKFDLAQAWYSLLGFHEHTADAGGGWPGYFSRWDADSSNMAHYSAAMNGYSDTEQTFRKALARLGNSNTGVSPGPGSGDRAAVMVYNGLSWRRGGPVVIEGLPAALREGPIEIVDGITGESMPWEAVPGTKRHVLFFAKDIPGVGYRIYTVRKSIQPPGVNATKFPIKITWNSEGAISSILVTDTGQELVHSSPEKPFGSLFIARGRETFLLEKAEAGEMDDAEGPVARRIRVIRKRSVLPLTELILYRGASYADLRFDVDLDRLRDSSAGVRYAIALPLPRSQQKYLDGAGFVMRVPQDILPGGGATQFTPVQFIHEQMASDWGVTLSSRDAAMLRPEDLFLLAAEDFHSATREEGSQQLYRTEPRSSSVQSFRFRIASQGEDKAGWKRFGAEHNLPLRAQVLTSGVPEASERGFFGVSDNRVQMLAFKPAEARPGWFVIRLQENSGSSVTGLKLTSRLRVLEATRANLVEEPEGVALDLANLSLGPWQTLTILVRLGV